MHPQSTPEQSNIPVGYCQCGCGKRTVLAAYTDPRNGSVKGEYRRFYRNHARRPITIFWDEVDMSGGLDACWEWQGNIGDNGYGRTRGQLAHRLAYTLAHGPIPKGLMICHRCANRRCCNPSHLYAGTAKDNARDMIEHGTPTECLTRNKNAKRGEGNVLAKLTDDIVREIRRLYATGDVTMSTLAKRYDTTITNISSVVNHKTWTHID